MTISSIVDKELEILLRGTVNILTVEDLHAKLTAFHKGERGPLRVKLGLDPTSPDLHLGHSVVLRKCRQFQDLGHKVVLIIGDGTSAVGDPSGRSKTRPILTRQEIDANCKTYFEQAGRILNLDESVLEITHNGDWFYPMTFTDVIKLASRMTVARLLERDDFKKRYSEGQPISLHELIYPLMQGYDSVMVKADVELGGTDQLFNLLVGRGMQPEFGQEAQVPMTCPLLVGLDGVHKMSKSLGNYVAVIDSPRDMFGKLMSLPDELMRNYFELLTDIPMDVIDKLLSAETHPMEAKKSLAGRIVEYYYGLETAKSEREEFERMFSRREIPQDIPVFDPPLADDGAYKILDIVMVTGAASSNRDARRIVQQGGFSVDGEKVDDPSARIALTKDTVVKIGKKIFARFRV